MIQIIYDEVGAISEELRASGEGQWADALDEALSGWVLARRALPFLCGGFSPAPQPGCAVHECLTNTRITSVCIRVFVKHSWTVLRQKTETPAYFPLLTIVGACAIITLANHVS
jgi:hypothetical protein